MKQEKNIFLEWRNRYGFTDERDEPRVSIIKGVDRANSAHYTLSFSSNFKLGLQSDKHFYLVSRHLRMTPNDTINLNNFLRSYLKCKSFIMAPYALGREIDFDSLHTVPSIRKRTLVVREAWTIGVNDPEMICLNVDDVPIIPDNVADAPIYRTLERLRRTRDNK